MGTDYDVVIASDHPPAHTHKNTVEVLSPLKIQKLCKSLSKYNRRYAV